MYFDTDESIGISRAGGTNVVEALLQFQNKNFKEACTLFTELMENDPDNLAIQYYCGISNMEISEYSNSIELFSGILKHGNSLYHDNAEWYLGLSYLITNENEKAKKQFEEIASDEGHDFNEDAKSILQKMAKSDSKDNFLNKILFFVLPF
jgi:tetratricopeptide (TPR) repeat protein